MEMAEIETVLETIWDLHDKISDAIHSISRSHFLSSIKTLSKGGRLLERKKKKKDNDDDDDNRGFVFVKDFRADDDDDDVHDAMEEARSLNAIRTALENLEDQLDFFHTVQLQQRAERDAALARLEQSRIILAMRLADHQGKKYEVIEEALAFVGDVRDASRFVAPENLYEMPRNQPGETADDEKGKRSSMLMRLLISSFALAKNSVSMDKIGGVLGNAALFAVSMLAFLQLHQVAFQSRLQDRNFYNKRTVRSDLEPGCSSQMRQFDVFSAKG